MIKYILFLFTLLPLNELMGQEYYCFDLNYNEPLALDNLTNEKIYFLGETHNISSNDLLDFQFLRCLNSKFALKAFVKEGSYSYNYFLNEYILTGNEKLLDTLSNSLGHYVDEQRAFLKQLQRQNTALPDDKKIKIYSIDAESFFHTQPLIRYWKEKWGKPTSRELAEVFQKLENFKSSSFSFFPNKTDKKIITRIISTVKPIFNANEQAFKEYLKEDFIHLKMILENHATLNRNEKTIALNFHKLHQLIKEDRYFFSYGKLHAQKQKGWLANRLNKSSAFENTVLTIKPIYKNSSISWKGSSVELNDYDELDNDIKSYVSSLICEKNWLLIPSTNEAFDFYIISKNQNGITVIEK